MRNPIPRFISEDTEKLAHVTQAVLSLEPGEINPEDVVDLLRWITVQITQDKETGELVEEAVGPWVEQARDIWSENHGESEENTDEFEEGDFGLDDEDEDDDYIDEGDDED